MFYPISSVRPRMTQYTAVSSYFKWTSIPRVLDIQRNITGCFHCSHHLTRLCSLHKIPIQAIVHYIEIDITTFTTACQSVCKLHGIVQCSIHLWPVELFLLMEPTAYGLITSMTLFQNTKNKKLNKCSWLCLKEIKNYVQQMTR